MNDFEFPDMPSINVISSPKSSNYHDNPQFVNQEDCYTEQTQIPSSSKFTYKVDSPNNMIIDSLKPTSPRLNVEPTGNKDLVAAIQENLLPANNMGSINQMMFAQAIRQESFQRYSDHVVERVESNVNEVVRF